MTAQSRITDLLEEFA